ncbi:WD repeat-containing protein [Reticulomyxa filosa]|uniref:WD repeat-containing protein n=1 Tax=Reticulomyxa filosa TaxID=46433 RepID=X6M2I8_RETFI|nr:WD repeat-containing protein [Reticulomyxa filosa]|eukprot:ETO07637.1 WD repeat-containing protein [Reticulomyxa filosa]
MTTSSNEKQTSTQLALVTYISFFHKLEEEIQIIIQHWIRVLRIRLGWIQDFDKLIVDYVMFLFVNLFFIQIIVDATTVLILDSFSSSSKLINTFTGHTDPVLSIDFSVFDNNQLLCSASYDKTIRAWDVETNQQIQLFSGHAGPVCCVKFSPYHYHNYHRNVICSSLGGKTIYFWDVKHNQQFQVFDEHNGWIGGIEFSPFNGGKYVCSGSWDKTIRLWDVETSKSLHIFKGHKNVVKCIDISPLQSNNNNNESNDIGVIGGNGYTICSGSCDNTIRIWDIETTKPLILFKGHENFVASVKYGSNELINTILSGSWDKNARLWDIRSGQQIQIFNKHTNYVCAVEYSPFVIKNSDEIIDGNSKVICSGSDDNTIRFWDIRSNKKELYIIKGHKKDDGICCLKFIELKKKVKNNEQNLKNNGCINLFYGSGNGPIRVWG